MGASSPSFLRRRRTQTSTTFEPRIEVVAPDRGQELLAAQHLARVLDEVVEEPELAVGEVDDGVADPRLAAREVEHRARPPRTQLPSPFRAGRRSCARTRASSSSSGERLGDVVVRAELEAAQLRGQVGAGGDDHDRQLGPVGAAARAGRSARRAAGAAGRGPPGRRRRAPPARAHRPVVGAVDGESLRLEPARRGTRGSGTHPR